ncbi:MAG TPA: bifunctional (p)ppGpp synthetase/guanosine-3',5'-bis(diphosphate) 3'-pyrophosphohydrolase [Hyphomicrobiaceae bacterium]|nr:bifunctional (p)ppGpp synthetase/guanosine-3',5'-bis(diphosphate) 3'-pyrophosphohydrolase [Hyphomicrobiaceae bacterium]
MPRQYELVERVQAYDPAADEALLNRAYVYAMKAHSNQKRASGDPYFSHPLEVASILTDLRLDDATIATALLHDVIEDTDTTRAEIDTLFGPEIGALVEGLTKIKKLDLVTKKAEQAENFRKLLIAISTDIRVLLVKLADRLHNMRTLGHVKPETRKRISEETLEIYAPLASRMGMRAMVEEFQDHAFRWLYPEPYATLNQRLDELRERNRGLVDDIHLALAEKMDEAGIDGEISGREKTPYAIWRKMENRQISLEQLSDIYGFRVKVDTVAECYQALGVVHASWRAVPGRFKDYISTPKQNGYRSIHTTIIGPRHQRVELQIRTQEMHRIAEYGVAAHALYKDAGSSLRSGPSIEKDSGPYGWLRRLVETLLEGHNPEEFLEHTKLELFHDQVFCFTPKGLLIALPQGATPIDFAYAVHTDIGHTAIGAVINGRKLALSTVLRNGDEVQILSSPKQQPSAAWERIAVTGRARAAIRRAVRDALRKQYLELGRRLLSQECQKVGISLDEERLSAALKRLSAKTVEEVFVLVGRGELPIRDAMRAIAPGVEPASAHPSRKPRNRHDHGQGQDGWFNLSRVMGLKFYLPGTQSQPSRNGPSSIPIRGFNKDLPVTFQEGGAVPGDRIVGVLVPQRGIQIFQIHSPLLREHESDNWIDVTWDIDPEHPERFPARIRVSAVNEPGSLAEIAQVIGEKDGNIDNLRMMRRAADFTDMVIEIDVWDLEHLNGIVSALKTKRSVSSVERIFS